MNSLLPDTSREKLEAWLRYYDDLGFGEFFIDRRTIGKRSVKAPAAPPHTAAQVAPIAAPAAASAAPSSASFSAIRGAPARILPVVPDASVFAGIGRLEGDT